MTAARAELPRRAFLGAELPADHLAFTPDGLCVDGVLPGGMADRAGVRGGDTIAAVAGLPVRTLAELAAALRAAGAAETAELRYARRGELRAAIVEVARAPEEASDGGELAYGVLEVAGARLRTIATRARAPRALVLVLPGIACESVDAAEAPLAQLAHGWARAGVDALRFDRRGLGDSEGGPCCELDFQTELADATTALAASRALAAERRVPLVLFGHSVGGLVTAHLAGASGGDDVVAGIAGVIVYGAPASRWLACLAGTTRRQHALRGDPPEVGERAAAELSPRALAVGLNGRSAAYHAQLDAIDPAALWAGVHAPVLVVRGEHDWVVRADDQARIARLAGGPAEIVDLPGLDHVLGRHADHAASLRDYGAGSFDASIVRATIEWIERL